MAKGEKIAGALIGTSALGTTVGAGYFAFGCLDATSAEYDSGLADFGDSTSQMWNGATDLADGNTPSLTTALGFISSVAGSSAGGGAVAYVIISENSKPYDVVEKRAKQIYDHYNSDHIKEKDEGASLLVVDPVTAGLIREVLESASSKTELISGRKTRSRKCSIRSARAKRSVL